MTAAAVDPLLDVYSEPCADCANGDHQHCRGRALDHPRDSEVPCPCRAAGHTALKETP